MNTETLPNFTVGELNHSIGNLLSRGFAPRFLLHASVSKSQLKNGHLWMTLTDGEANISGVIWSSCLQKLNFRPTQEDGVEIIGKLNFWENRANLVVQVIDIRPTLSTVLRQFEVVRNLLVVEGLIDEKRRRPLPKFPTNIAVLTSVPSSAYADMTFVSWGGAYTASQQKAYVDTWSKGSGVTVENYNGGLGEIKAQVEANNVTWDVVDVLPDQAITGCDEGLFLKVDQSHFINDMVVKPVSECISPQIFWSYVVFYDPAAFPGKKPKTIISKVSNFSNEENSSGGESSERTLKSL